MTDKQVAEQLSIKAVMIAEDGPRGIEPDKKYRRKCSAAFKIAALAWVGVDLKIALTKLAIAHFMLDPECDAPAQVGAELIEKLGLE